MGKHGNGDLPPDGDRPPDEPLDLPDLPDLPDGIVIPDDLSALADEADHVHAELSGDLTQQPPSGSYGIPRREPSAAMPLVIMSIAVVITLVSLFAMAWSTSQPAPRAGTEGTGLPEDVVLTDGTGQGRNVAALAPAAILLLEGCTDCSGLIADTVAAAPANVTVVAVGHDAPSSPPDLPLTSGNVVLLADPEGSLRSSLNLGAPPAQAATVVLATRDRITLTNPATDTVESFSDELSTLGG